MFKKNILLRIAVVLLLASVFSFCRNEPSKISQMKSRILKSESLLLKEVLLYPFRIAVLDSFVAVDCMDRKKERAALLINQNSGESISFGSLGEGPGELLSAWQIFSNHKEQSVEIYDVVQKRYSIFRLDSILKNSNTKPLQLTFAKLRAITPLHLQRTGGAGFVMCGGFNNGIVASYNIADSGAVYGNGEIVGMEKFATNIVGQVLDFKPLYNQQTKQVALLSMNSDNILIFDSLLTLKYSTIPLGGIVPNFKVVNEYGVQLAILKRDSRTIYSCVAFTDQYIFALYSGQVDIMEKNAILDKQMTEMHLFNWQGELVEVVKLDSPIISFAIDEQGKTIYGLSTINEPVKILKFTL